MTEPTTPITAEEYEAAWQEAEQAAEIAAEGAWLRAAESAGEPLSQQELEALEACCGPDGTYGGCS